MDDSTVTPIATTLQRTMLYGHAVTSAALQSSCTVLADHHMRPAYVQADSQASYGSARIHAHTGQVSYQFVHAMLHFNTVVYVHESHTYVDASGTQKLNPELDMQLSSLQLHYILPKVVWLGDCKTLCSLH